MSFTSNLNCNNNYYNVNCAEFKPSEKSNKSPIATQKNKENIDPNLSCNNPNIPSRSTSNRSYHNTNTLPRFPFTNSNDENSKRLSQYSNPNSYTRNFSQREANAKYILAQKISSHSEKITDSKLDLTASTSIDTRMDQNAIQPSRDQEYTKWNVHRNITRKNILIDNNHLDNISEIMKIIETIVYVNCVYDIHDAFHIPCKRQTSNSQVSMIGQLEIGIDKNNRANHAFFVPKEKIKKYDPNLIIDDISKNRLHSCIFNFESLVKCQAFKTITVADNDGTMTFLLKI